MNTLKRYFLIDAGVTFLNHGSFGATPAPVFRAYQNWQRELERQPVEFLGRRYSELMAGARQSLATYLGTRADNVVYVTNVTLAVNIVARSLKLGPGDEVLATDHEYGACDRVWRFLARKQGFTYINQPVPLPLTTEAAFVECLWQRITPRTRLIFLSHITSPTAAILPVGEVCRRARRDGILTLVDGAHAPGQIPLDLEVVGADFYGANLHKWLCAPKGAGFLYARPEVQDLLEPLIVSWGYEAETPGASRFVDYHEYQGTRDIAAFLSVPEAIRFQQTHDWDAVRRACHDLACQAEHYIRELCGQPSLYCNDSWFGQMVSVRLPDEIAPDSLKTGLYEEFRIEVPIIKWNNLKLIRVSFQGYNSYRDVNYLLKALRQVL